MTFMSRHIQGLAQVPHAGPTSRSVRARGDTKTVSSQEHKKEQEEVRALVDSDPDGRPSYRQLWPCPGHGLEADGRVR